VKKLLKAIAVGGLAFLTGCASIMTGSTQAISFNSSPPGASIVVDGADMGKTPATLNLKRNKGYAVSIQLEGYETQAINLDRSVNGWVWGNILLGGLIGLVVDASTGAMYKLTPEQVSATMGQTVAYDGTGDMLVVAIAMNVDPSWQKVGQLQAR